MTIREIVLASGYRLTSVREDDCDRYVGFLADGEIAGTIPVIPQPYTRESAQWWIRHRLTFLDKTGMEVCFAIRQADGALVGSVGVDDLVPGTAHNGELGYWLGREHRGRGIARGAVQAFIPYAFDHLALDRLTAHTLHFNSASIRVIEGAGFKLEGRLRQYTRTSTGIHDTLVYGLLRNEWSTQGPSNPPLAPTAQKRGG
jgi:RimJ/RimL family protein N-acetyltransferase